MKLNLGCGEDVREGYLNVDRRPGPGVDVVCDVRALPFRKGSAEAVLASDIVEHIPWREIPTALSEWRRVLSDAGKLVLRTPSLEGLIRLYRTRPPGWRREDAGEKGIDPIVERLYGSQDYPGNFHHVIFDQQAMTALLGEQGFFVHEVVPDGEDISNLTVTALKALRGEEKYSLDRDCPHFEGCPIVARFLERIDAVTLVGEAPIRGCSDDVRFYEARDLMNGTQDEDPTALCPAMQACRLKVGRQRVTWEAPVFGPSGYAFASRGSVIGLDDLGARVSPRPLWGDCTLTLESEDNANE